MLVPKQLGFTDDSIGRVLQGLIAGIGFLGAGAIVKGDDEDRVQGLTTAAGIWLTAAIGVAVGLGRDASAILATVLALLILRVVPALLEKRLPSGRG
ncbi:MAG: MgtC/SapB family protein [Pirellulales bacterium]